MKELIASLLLFISAETNYNTDLPMPNIVQMDQKDLEEKYYKNTQGSGDKLYAFYGLEDDTIYLSTDWDIHKPWDKAVLLHELIHYVQDMTNAKVDCVQKLEAEAWPLQAKYLRQYHGIIWDYDDLWFFFISTCNNNLN